MSATFGIRTKIAVVATIATVQLLSAVGTIGYVAAVNATRQSQLDQLNERLDVLEDQLADDRTRLVSQLELEASLHVVRDGGQLPAPAVGTLQVARPSDIDGVEAVVGIVSTRQIDETFRTIRIGLWISIIAAGLLVGVISWIVVDRALAPVRRLTAQAKAIEADTSSELLTVDSSGDELADLASTFNAMITKLRSADTERRRFVSDASHELRTPLMVLSADAEFALNCPAPTTGPGTGQLAESVVTQTERLTTLVDDLLTLASIDEGHRPSNRVVSVSDMLDAVDAPDLTVESGSDLSCRIPDVSRAVGNVVTNAQRHCAEAIRLSVAVDASAGAVLIEIDDDGPGIPAGEREYAFKRFARLDDGRTRSEGGAGLGLAIARAEVNQAGGTIAIGDSPLGGARFTIRVPVAREGHVAG